MEAIRLFYVMLRLASLNEFAEVLWQRVAEPAAERSTAARLQQLAFVHAMIDGLPAYFRICGLRVKMLLLRGILLANLSAGVSILGKQLYSAGTA